MKLFRLRKLVARAKVRPNAKQGAWDRLLPRLKFECLEDRSLLASDFGDAWFPYPSTLAEDGPRHVAIGPTLGAVRDTEPDGGHSRRADGDDIGTVDDEDGITFGTFVAGTNGNSVTVNVQDAPNGAFLDAWLDFDLNGVFDPGEQIFSNLSVGNGDNVRQFALPANAVAGNTFARFRLSTAGGLAPTGPAADGEVEDYLVTIFLVTPLRQVDLEVVVRDTDPVKPGSGAGNLSYQVEVQNAGPSNASGVALNLSSVLPAGVSFFSAIGIGSNNVDGAGTDTWAIGDLAVGASAYLQVRYTVSASTTDGATVSLTASVAAANEELINLGNDAETENTTVQLGVDLRVAMFRPFGSPDSITAGSGVGNLVYSAAVYNDGPYEVSDLTLDISNVLPAGVSFVSVNGAGASNFDGEGTDTWTITNLGVGSSVWLNVYYTASGSTANGAIVSFTARVAAASETLINLGNDEGTIYTVVTAHDSGDAPAPFPGARHVASGATLGPTRDSEGNAQGAAPANRDDLAGIDDEDGLVAQSLLIAGANGSVTVNVQGVSQTYFLSAWIDFNHNGDWLDPGEQIATDFEVTTDGDQVLNFTVPLTVASGASTARFRLSTLAGLSFTGDAPDGEVEDHRLDGDGIDDSVEDGAPNGGDGNGDGLPDSQQVNVASLPNSVDQQYFTIAAPENASLGSVTAIENPSPADSPENVYFPVGFVSFSVEDVPSAAATTVEIFLPAGATADTYYKFGPTPDNATPHWYEFLFDGMTGAEFSDDGRVITLHFVDGARGDDDLTANGRIVDPGVPGQLGPGNVTVNKIQDNPKDARLEIVGDTGSNQIQIELGVGGVKGSVHISGLEGTTITGLADFTGINKGIKVSLLSGNDSVTVNGSKVAGPITLELGEGNDTYVINASKTAFVLNDLSGTDVLDFSAQTKAVTVDLSMVNGKSQRLGNGNTATVVGQFERILGSPFNDTLKGNAADNRIIGGAGNDKIDGREGKDTLSGGLGKDSLLGSDGDDSLDGGENDDKLDGGAGNDIIRGGSGKDTLIGGLENDTLFGDGDNDKLDGGLGNDFLRGGEGNDTLTDGGGHNVLLGEGGNDKITGGVATKKLPSDTNFDLLIGGAGIDTLTAGKQGNTILIGGRTDYDLNNDAALRAILSEWSPLVGTASAPLGDRIFNLKHGGGRNGDTVLTSKFPSLVSGRVIDDGLLDTLIGSGKDNWFFKQGDKIKEKIPLGTVQT